MTVPIYENTEINKRRRSRRLSSLPSPWPLRPPCFLYVCLLYPPPPLSPRWHKRRCRLRITCSRASIGGGREWGKDRPTFHLDSCRARAPFVMFTLQVQSKGVNLALPITQLPSLKPACVLFDDKI